MNNSLSIIYYIIGQLLVSIVLNQSLIVIYLTMSVCTFEVFILCSYILYFSIISSTIFLYSSSSISFSIKSKPILLIVVLQISNIGVQSSSSKQVCSCVSNSWRMSLVIDTMFTLVDLIITSIFFTPYCSKSTM